MYGEIGTKPTVMPHIECGRIAILRMGYIDVY